MPLTALTMRNDVWMDGVAVAGQDLRLQQAGAFLTGASPSGSTGIAARPGVRYGTGSPLLVGTSSGMTLSVNAGIAWVQGTAAANSGMYTGCLDTAGTVTLATSDPTNPRIDNIIVQVTDLGTSGSTTVVTPQTGTPAASPVAPTLPANSLLLAQVAVGAGVSSITAGNITDKRVYTTSVGGIVPMANTSGGISGAAGLYAHDLSTGRLRASDGSGNARAPKVGAFAPVTQAPTSPVSISSVSNTTVASVTVAVDGATEIEIFVQWRGFNQNPSPTVGSGISHQLWVDGSRITDASGQNFAWDQVKATAQSTNLEGGGCYRALYTPAAGTHTFAWIASATAANMNVVTPFLRVASSLQQ